MYPGQIQDFKLGGAPLFIYMYCIYITTTTLHVFRINLNCALDINVSKCSDCMVNVRAIAS